MLMNRQVGAAALALVAMATAIGGCSLEPARQNHPTSASAGSNSTRTTASPSASAGSSTSDGIYDPPPPTGPPASLPTDATVRDDASALAFVASYIAALNRAFHSPTPDNLRLAGWGEDTCSGCNGMASKIGVLHDHGWHVKNGSISLRNPTVVSSNGDTVIIEGQYVLDEMNVYDASGKHVIDLPSDDSLARYILHWTDERWNLREIKQIGSS
ncbi:hypothetical protein ATK17_2454 [Branchiibius hedensis]|uniref:Lipoprotein n=1 Tax=Branchiibius hedensis TaxID=672460 RepID=A0A2Y9C1X8_9MICO|nr:hypothetical protein ATK17_2454 [Branchiibius hedensis]SSA35113.1 hypothetical protein SAMN04489750_2454 [Branchiibius hedensis]